MAAGQVLLDGVQVIAVQAGPRFEIFRILWERYLEDLQSGLEPEQFRTLPLTDLASALESRLGRPYPDETTVRRYVNRLQSDLEAAVKRKLGLPVGREDIIQTLAWQGQTGDDYGYRLNPYRVLLGPHLPAATRSAS
jgi:hypothetical protein